MAEVIVEEEATGQPGFRYRTEKFEFAWVASFWTNEEAIAFMSTLSELLDESITYVERHEPGNYREFKALPITYDRKTKTFKEVTA